MNDDPRRRTYSSWWFLLAFTVLAGLGLAGLLFLGTPSGPTEIVPTAQTLPEDPSTAADGATATTDVTEEGVDDDSPSTPDPPSAGAPRFADGTPAPDEVTEVLIDGDTTVLAFALDEGTDLTAFDTRTAPVSAVILDDGKVLGVRVGCGVSADELLAQLTVVESAGAVTLTALTLVPPEGAPCVPGAEVAFVEMPLRSAVGGRDVRVTPPGDPVSD